VQSGRLADPLVIEQLSSAIGGGARALVKQPKTAVFLAVVEVRIYRMLALKMSNKQII